MPPKKRLETKQEKGIPPLNFGGVKKWSYPSWKSVSETSFRQSRRMIQTRGCACCPSGLANRRNGAGAFILPCAAWWRVLHLLHCVCAWAQETIDYLTSLHKQAHRDLFPLSQNFMALIVISTVNLSKDQRQSLTSIMAHSKRTMDQYGVTKFRDVFIYSAVLDGEDRRSNDESMSIRWKKSISRNGVLDDVVWIWDDTDYTHRIREDSKEEELER